jgi:hypothetical protein
MMSEPIPLHRRIANALAAGRPLNDVTDEELAAEIREYVEQEDGEISSGDAAILLAAAERLHSTYVHEPPKLLDDERF